MLEALVVGGACFGFNLLHYYIGAKVSDAERQLQPRRGSNWSAAAEALQWADFIVFTGLAQTEGIIYAALICALPSIVGAKLGSYRSIRSNFVLERLAAKGRRERREARRLAKAQPPA
jgi:predicted lipid-binding transport protein (Tim44 family)